MNKFFIFSSAILLSLSCCTEQEPKNELVTNGDSLTCINSEQLNPNGDSEMALLMREMVNFSEETKNKLAEKKELLPYPSEFEKILTAKTTDSTLNKAVLASFSNNYLTSLKKIYDSPKDSIVKNFNLMINSCITCHENFCHGPIKRIKKMLLQE